MRGRIPRVRCGSDPVPDTGFDAVPDTGSDAVPDPVPDRVPDPVPDTLQELQRYRGRCCNFLPISNVKVV